MSTSVRPFAIRVRLAEPLREGAGEFLSIDTPVRTIGELIPILQQRLPQFLNNRDELFNFAVNGNLVVHGEKNVALESGDEVEILVSFSGG